MSNLPKQAMRAAGIALLLLPTIACHHPIATESTAHAQPHQEAAPHRSAAESQFWEVFGAGAYDRIPSVLQELESESSRNPNDARLVLLTALTHLWRIAEIESAHSPDPRADLQASISGLQRYAAMRPDDVRVAFWLGPALASGGGALLEASSHVPDAAQRAAMEQQANAMLADALHVIDAAVQREPRFGYFGRLVVAGGFPRESAPMQQALANLGRFHDLRLGAHLDPEHPDLAPFLSHPSACNPSDPPGPNASAATSDESTLRTDPRCWNTWKTPFSYEGFWLYSGDLALRGGQSARARALYENARRFSDHFATWPYRSLIEDRLAHLDEWSARLGDADPTNDPVLVFRGPHGCLACHQRAAQSATSP